MNSYGPTAFMQIHNFAHLQWRLPLALAVAVHIITFILLVFPPTFFLPEHNIEEIQTINLFTVDEFQQKTQPPKPLPARQQTANTPPPKDTAQSTALEAPAPQAPPARVTSLHPRRLKKKIAKEPTPPPSPKVDTRRQKALERIQARVNQKIEDEKLKHDLSSLRDALHDSVKVTGQTQQNEPTDRQQEQSPTPSSQGTDVLLNEAKRRYFIAIQRRILDNWSLPKTQEWDNNLESIIVIYIEKTGVISKTIFEKKSKNAYFNQYVEKTVQAAAPMPPIPASLK